MSALPSFTVKNADSFSSDRSASSEAAPLYKHDCEQCVFLGRYVAPDGDYVGKYDLYYHGGDTAFTRTVIARYGAFGDYVSGLHFAAPYRDIDGIEWPGMPMLVEAKRRAIARGLIEAGAPQ